MTEPMYSVTTHDGLTVPIIDITHPAFAVSITDEALANDTAQFIRESRVRAELSPEVIAALTQSRIGGALMAAAGTVFGGTHTYLLKLGPENLGAWATPIDKSIVASFPAFATRLRLQDTATFIADAVAAAVPSDPARLVRLINIGGGPAADSWNALLLLRRRSASLVAGRPFLIAVFDPDENGPRLGAAALAELTSSGAPLEGVDVRLEHVAYDWANAVQLRTALEHSEASKMHCVFSSEGALFEYGSDEDIVANLDAIRAATSADTTMAGSVTRAGDAYRASQTVAVTTKPRTLEQFRGLVERAGWSIRRVIERPFSYNVCLGVDQRVQPR